MKKFNLTANLVSDISLGEFVCNKELYVIFIYDRFTRHTLHICVLFQGKNIIGFTTL